MVLDLRGWRNFHERKSVYTFSSVGSFAVSLGATNTAGSNTTTMPAYINVTNAASPPITSFKSTYNLEPLRSPSSSPIHLLILRTAGSGRLVTGHRYRSEPVTYVHPGWHLLGHPDGSKLWRRQYHDHAGFYHCICTSNYNTTNPGRNNCTHDHRTADGDAVRCRDNKPRRDPGDHPRGHFPSLAL